VPVKDPDVGWLDGLCLLFDVGVVSVDSRADGAAIALRSSAKHNVRAVLCCFMAVAITAGRAAVLVCFTDYVRYRTKRSAFVRFLPFCFKTPLNRDFLLFRTVVCSVILLNRY